MRHQKKIAQLLIGILLCGQVSVLAMAQEATESIQPPVAEEEIAPATPQEEAPPLPAEPQVVTPPTPTPVAIPTPVEPTTGPQQATGIDPASTGPDEPTGKKPEWVFNTATGKWEEAKQETFTWDSKTGYWLSPLYWYDTRIGWYKILTPSEANSTSRPSYLITSPDAPKIVSSPIGDLVVGSDKYKMALALGLINDPAISNTGPNSNNTALVHTTSNGWLDFTNLVGVINLLQSNAQSGDANVSGNTTADSAVTGAVSIVANILNLLSSAWSWSNGGLTFLLQNFFGSHVGDIRLQPVSTQGGGGSMGTAGGLASNTNTGPNSNNDAAIENDNNLTVNSQNEGSIVNDVDLQASSGNANITGNTSAGSATTGDATIEINIINLINSLISSDQSFFAMLNIFGDFNGDILFPEGFLDGLIENGTNGYTSASNSNTGPGSTNIADSSNTSNADINLLNSNLVDNQINANAQSGSANVNGNNSAGSAITGSAKTSQSLFNLSNINLAGDNAVLVIVNVMGRWMGKIMNVGDGGNTSALLTGGASVSNTNTGTDSTNVARQSTNTNTDIDASNEGRIINRVNAEATSGDANVTDNTLAGNASTGNAQVASNVANIFGSQFSLRKWFGVLVINVFGKWFGSVGQDTEAGNVATVSQQSGGMGGGQYVATSGVGNTNSNNTNYGVAGASGNSNQVLGVGVSSTENPTQVLAAKSLPVYQAAKAAANGTMLLLLGAALMILMAGLMMGIERKMRTRSL